MTCEICNKRAGKLFLRVTQPQGNTTHSAKAHACPVCLFLLQGDKSVSVEEISQQDYNELPENQP